jgi:hypothetical protein
MVTNLDAPLDQCLAFLQIIERTIISLCPILVYKRIVKPRKDLNNMDVYLSPTPIQCI